MHAHALCAHLVPEEGSEPLELELQLAVSQHTSDGN